VSRIIAIEDPADPRLAPYRDLRDRDLRDRGDFIAEGEVVLRTLLRAGRHPVRSMLLAERQAERLADLIATAPDNVLVYAAPQAVMDQIVGFPIHRGILAHGQAAPTPSADALLAGLTPDAVVLGLMGIANHDNVGGLFRNAAAFGAAGVVLDADCCPPLYRKSIRVSVGAALTIPFVQLAPRTDVLGLFERHGFEVVALSPVGGRPLRDLRRAGRTAVLLGTEGAGLSPGLMARTRTVCIPMAPGFDSLNVGVTSGIVLHHLMQGAGTPHS
jgi:tRNA G18 (ribose-2'-O)-methylase SpoU